jgi:D-alanyl-lipoteichoic acid acyltransferase DltB (MBOAT superfamily)
MLFPTVDYAIFFLVVFVLAWTFRRPLVVHKLILLVASYIFYGFWSWAFLPLLIGISLWSVGVARALQALRPSRLRTGVVAGGVIGALGTLAFFKYLGFFASAVVPWLQWTGIAWSPRLPEIALPVGVSFFVFHGISLMVDAYRGKLAAANGRQGRVSVLDALLYVAFFPQLVAGPILRASSFMPQLRVPRDPGDIDAARGMELVALGLAKKVLVANFLAGHLVDGVFEDPFGRSGLEVLTAIYGYAGQIYCDFSGYTDIAIGCALLLGYQFPANFDAPYTATNPQDFWHRWHISLSTWLRDYLFIPLGGSRGTSARTAFNLFLTMVLGGLWHGAAWSFIAWGALHGAALVLHRTWARSKSAAVGWVRGTSLWRAASPLLTFHLVCLGWVFFRAPTMEVGLDVLRSLAQPWTLGAWATPGLALALAAGVLGQALPDRPLQWVRESFARLPLVIQGATFGVAVFLIEALGPSGIPPFIYFQF